mmetsp:Transcript_26865/g.64093  ORF Transcript_26865/g.64093 Transcript_26865/m.64093 type:complete len:232 (+) Transcript_26865:2073-2768(+)
MLVADAIPPRGEVERGHGVEEARGEAPEAAVAERRILLLLHHVLELVANLLESLLVGLLEVEVHEGVEERAAHEELEGEVVDALRVLLEVVRLGVAEGLDKVVAHREGHSLVRGAVVEVVAVSGERVLGVVDDRLLDGELVSGLVLLGERPDLVLLRVRGGRPRALHVRVRDVLLRRRAGHADLDTAAEAHVAERGRARRREGSAGATDHGRRDQGRVAHAGHPVRRRQHP